MVCAAADVALERERLHAELESRVAELAGSRARLVEAGDAARRRLERDLHDGAQQRLVSLAIALRITEDRMRCDPETAAGLLAEARKEVSESLEELRELARGIHPAVLEHGLDVALGSLADAVAHAGDAVGRPGRAAAGGGRARRVLRRVGGAGQRRQVRAGVARRHPRHPHAAGSR